MQIILKTSFDFLGYTETAFYHFCQFAHQKCKKKTGKISEIAEMPEKYLLLNFVGIIF